ncbi:MAG: hypothetical protein WCD53_12615 [Microcoleus sp.]
MGITANNAEVLQELIQKAAIEGEVVQENTTDFGQQFKVDWTIPIQRGLSFGPSGKLLGLILTLV